MSIGEAVSQRILNLCDEHHITLNALSNLCGITQSTLNNIKTGKSKNPTVSTVKKVCDGLSISLIDFFGDPLFDSLDPEIK